MRLRRRESLGVAIVEHRVVERADAAGGVERFDACARKSARRARAARASSGSVFAFTPGKHRRHEAADGLGIDDRVADLPGLLRHQPAPDRVALGPEVLALVVEARGVAIDHRRPATRSRRACRCRRRTAARARRWRRMCDCDGSPIVSAPASIMNFSSTPMLKRVPRIRKLSAGHSPSSFWPQASRSHARFDSKPPAASTQARASMRSVADARGDEPAVAQVRSLDRRVVANLSRPALRRCGSTR